MQVDDARVGVEPGEPLGRVLDLAGAELRRAEARLRLGHVHPVVLPSSVNRLCGKFWNTGSLRLPGTFPVSIEGTATVVEAE